MVLGTQNFNIRHKLFQNTVSKRILRLGKVHERKEVMLTTNIQTAS